MKANTQVQNVLVSEVDPALVDESKAVDLILKSGDVSVHHRNVIHGSKANHSPLRRCGLTIRYIPISTRIKAPNWPCTFLLRGDAVPGINHYVEVDHMFFNGKGNWI
ncbi:hypothetical protein GCM10010911_55570 [Paenibacillus nasutitermitis]|uniref:Phytanoyl-CoA dioxygenase n=2 Tax=Paenibacillus nasutitermitis TaxID=1652958 RepID=A0A917E1I0_9BACL|nr:hypothetical protein GCM10010911_55570 [Paenibacillus nasutitermitis]